MFTNRPTCLTCLRGTASWGLLLCTLILSAGCGALPPATPTPTVPATATPGATPSSLLPTPTPEPATPSPPAEEATMATQLLAPAPFQLPLRDPWIVTDRDSAALAAYLDQASNAQTGLAVQLLAQAAGSLGAVQVALHPDPVAPVGLTLLAAPRNGILLPDYVDQMRAGLESAGMTVLDATVTTERLPDGTPAGELIYSQPEAALHFYQMVRFDEAGTAMAILTFVMPAAQAEGLLPTLRELAATLQETPDDAQ